MYRIGCVNIETSHPKTFAVNMKKHKLDMCYYGIFNDGFRTEEEVASFMKDTNVAKHYSSLKEMAKDVDIGFIHDCNWDKHINHAMSFIEAGKPVFVDKPIVGNLKDCLKIEELVKNGAKIIGSSSIRYAMEITELKKKISTDKENIATVFGIAGTDEFNYGIHIMEGIHGLLGKGVYSVRYLGVSRNGNSPAEQYLVKWENGIQVIYQTQSGISQRFHINVTTDKTVHHITIDTTQIYIELLKRIEAYMKKNTPMSSVDELTETVKIYLAGKKSRETGGLEIAIQGLSLNDDGYDGYLFEKQYEIQRSTKK